LSTPSQQHIIMLSDSTTFPLSLAVCVFPFHSISANITEHN